MIEEKFIEIDLPHRIIKSVVSHNFFRDIGGKITNEDFLSINRVGNLILCRTDL